jgi:signal peptidase I
MKKVIKKIFRKKEKKTNKKDIILDNIYSLLIALFVAVLIRSFLVQAFYIPSGSMKPGLLEGDYVFVTKYNYGYSKHALPFSIPILPKDRLFYSEPQRGEVVIFKTPSDNSTDYVKRLIGKPGDKIQIINSVVYLNNKPLKRELIKEEIIDGISFIYYKETIPVAENEEKSYIIREIKNFPYYDVKFYGPIIVPEDQFFMMGDNRDQSKDSRFSEVGLVPKENLMGRGGMVFFSINGDFLEIWKWPTEIRWDRFFKIIR